MEPYERLEAFYIQQLEKLEEEGKTDVDLE
jgi:hypothetical protein